MKEGDEFSLTYVRISLLEEETLLDEPLSFTQ